MAPSPAHLTRPTGNAARRIHRAFTLLELLTVLAIISLLLAILLPSLATARRSGQRTKCLELLRNLGIASAAYANGDPRDQPLAAHPIADVNPDHDEGYYDYGGATGAANVFGGTRYGPDGPRTAATRPLNQYILGAGAGESTDYSAFRCPGDNGWPYGTCDGWVQWDDNLVGQPFYESVGTSFHANAARVPGFGTPIDYCSFSPYLRAISRIPLSEETILYCESLLWTAAFHTDQAYPADPEDVLFDGWHGPEPRFNVVFASGGAKTIKLEMVGFAGQYIPSDPDYAGLWLGQRGWRFHCRPDDLIPDPP
ncbi:MAG: prepilin-type N-terminal cleavage/methylation domain-containing protein [Planctomycetota bacterium]